MAEAPKTPAGGPGGLSPDAAAARDELRTRLQGRGVGAPRTGDMQGLVDSVVDNSGVSQVAAPTPAPELPAFLRSLRDDPAHTTDTNTPSRPLPPNVSTNPNPDTSFKLPSISLPKPPVGRAVKAVGGAIGGALGRLGRKKEVDPFTAMTGVEPITPTQPAAENASQRAAREAAEKAAQEIRERAEAEAAARAGRLLTAAERSGLGSRITSVMSANVPLFHKPVREVLGTIGTGYVVGRIVRQGFNLAFTPGLLASAGAGAVAGSIMKQRFEAQRIRDEMKDSGRTGEWEAARKKWKVDMLAGWSAGDRKRMAKAATVGAVTGAIGGALGFEVNEFFNNTELGNQIKEVAGSKLQGIKSSVFGDGSAAPEKPAGAPAKSVGPIKAEATPLPESYKGIIPPAEIDAAGGKIVSSHTVDESVTIANYLREHAGRGLSEQEFVEATKRIFTASGLADQVAQVHTPEDLKKVYVPPVNTVLDLNSAKEYAESLKAADVAKPAAAATAIPTEVPVKPAAEPTTAPAKPSPVPAEKPVAAAPKPDLTPTAEEIIADKDAEIAELKDRAAKAETNAQTLQKNVAPLQAKVDNLEQLNASQDETIKRLERELAEERAKSASRPAAAQPGTGTQPAPAAAAAPAAAPTNVTPIRPGLSPRDLDLQSGNAPVPGPEAALSTTIPQEIFKIPGVEKTPDGFFTVSIQPGSNPWEVARQIGGAYLNPDGSPLAADDERVRAIAKKLVVESAGYEGQAGIKVPNWTETQGPQFTLNHTTEVRAGYKLNFNKNVLDTISSFSKSAESNIVPFPSLADADLKKAA